ncbi:MAG: hydrogenase small subunit [Candidatus Bipolaricaulota bacterium]
MNRSSTRPVVWFQAAGCTGCSISLMNADYPDIKNLILDEVVPGERLSMVFHSTLMGRTGRASLEVLGRVPGESRGEYVLIVEGAIPTGGKGYGMVGEQTMADKTASLAQDALAVLALGSCASYGGIPAGAPNPTGCKGVGEFLRDVGVEAAVVNVPGCPPHPRWFVESVAYLLLGKVGEPGAVDEVGRVTSVYRGLIHEHCPRRPDFDVGRFAQQFGEEGCLYELGCKGPYTDSHCPDHALNAGVNWCIKAGHPCIACCEPEFLDGVSPLYRKLQPSSLNVSGRRS